MKITVHYLSWCWWQFLNVLRGELQTCSDSATMTWMELCGTAGRPGYQFDPSHKWLKGNIVNETCTSADTCRFHSRLLIEPGLLTETGEAGGDGDWWRWLGDAHARTHHRGWNMCGWCQKGERGGGSSERRSWRRQLINTTSTWWTINVWLEASPHRTLRRDHPSPRTV